MSARRHAAKPCAKAVARAAVKAPVDAELVGQRGAAVVGDRERPPARHPFHPARGQETIEHGAAQPTGQVMALLGPVHAVAHEWPFARWYFHTYAR